MEVDYYQTLGVSRTASEAEIQKAYRNLARKYHPDVNPDDQSAKKKFQQVQKAYEVLGNKEKRAQYDQYGSNFEEMQGAPGGGRWHYTGPGGGPGGAGFDFEQSFGGGRAGGEFDFGDIFRHFAGKDGGRRRRPRTLRGRDVRHQLEVPFQTAVRGGEARIAVQRPDGQVQQINVKIPPGIEPGKTIRLRGQGEPGEAGGQHGDLLIRIQVAPHPFFRRIGRNLELTLPVMLGEAALGAKVDVPTPNGVITLTIPAGSSGGRRLRIKGQGVPSPSDSPGDLFAVLQIVLPDGLEPTDSIRDIEQKYRANPRENLRW